MGSTEKTGNHFHVLGLPETAEMDQRALRERYFEAQRIFHPDKATGPEERLRFMQHSADINRAYYALRDEDSRLFHLLALKGVDLTADTPGFAVPSTLLMEVMEWREQSEAAVSAAERLTLQERFANSLRELQRQCKEALAVENMKEATDTALRLKYLAKIVRDMNAS